MKKHNYNHNHITVCQTKYANKNITILNINNKYYTVNINKDFEQTKWNEQTNEQTNKNEWMKKTNERTNNKQTKLSSKPTFPLTLKGSRTDSLIQAYNSGYAERAERERKNKNKKNNLKKT